MILVLQMKRVILRFNESRPVATEPEVLQAAPQAVAQRGFPGWPGFPSREKRLTD
jgi:hypothetical protein